MLETVSQWPFLSWGFAFLFALLLYFSLFLSSFSYSHCRVHTYLDDNLLIRTVVFFFSYFFVITFVLLSTLLYLTFLYSNFRLHVRNVVFLPPITRVFTFHCYIWFPYSHYCLELCFAVSKYILAALSDKLHRLFDWHTGDDWNMIRNIITGLLLILYYGQEEKWI